MNYLIYCRKSSESEERQILSLDSQEETLVQLAKKNNLNVVEIFRESKSAKKEGRPLFTDMLKLLAKGKIDGVICWKLDRLARNMADGGRIIDLLQRGVIKEIRTPEATHLPSDNVLMLAVQLGMANQYIRDLSENVKRGNRTKLEHGDFPNRPPVGYLNDKLNKKIIVDESRKKYIVRMFELYATGGYSFKEISNILFSEGLHSTSGKKILKHKIQIMLSNPFYYGTMSFSGKLYQGNHMPLISKDLYDKCQEVGDKRGRPHMEKHFFPLRGFVTCDTCGCMYTTALKKGKYNYYYCTNGKGICNSHKSYMTDNDIYKRFVPILETLTVDPELVEIMYQSALEQSGTDTAYFDETIQNLQTTLQALTERESRLLDTFLDQSISKEVYDKKSLEISNTIFQTKQNIQEIELKKQNVISTLEPTRNLFLDCNTWADSFLGLTAEKKHEVIKTVLWNLSMKGKNIYTYQLKSPYDLISKVPKITTLDELRREGDLNSRLSYPNAGFRNQCLQPLSHLSKRKPLALVIS